MKKIHHYAKTPQEFLKGLSLYQAKKIFLVIVLSIIMLIICDRSAYQFFLYGFALNCMLLPLWTYLGSKDHQTWKKES